MVGENVDYLLLLKSTTIGLGSATFAEMFSLAFHTKFLK